MAKPDVFIVCPLTEEVWWLVIQTACGIPRAARTNYDRLGGFKQQECVLSGSGGQNLKSRCWWGCASSKGSRATTPQPPLPLPPSLFQLWELLASLGFWSHNSSCHLPDLPAPLCVSLFSPFLSLLRTLILTFRVLSTPGQSSLEIIFLLTHVKIRSPSEVAGGRVFCWSRDWTHCTWC